MTERKTATAKKAKTAKAPKVPVDMQKKLLHYMKLTREIEYRIERVLYRQGKIVGGVYVGRGQEEKLKGLLHSDPLGNAHERAVVGEGGAESGERVALVGGVLAEMALHELRIA